MNDNQELIGYAVAVVTMIVICFGAVSLKKSTTVTNVRDFKINCLEMNLGKETCDKILEIK